MNRSITRVAILVRDYDEAIAYYTGSLGFALVENTDMGNGKRFVVVAPKGGPAPLLLLARAANAEQASRIGNQTGGRVFLFLHTDDFWRDYNEMKSPACTSSKNRAMSRSVRSWSSRTFTATAGIWCSRFRLAVRSCHEDARGSVSPLV